MENTTDLQTQQALKPLNTIIQVKGFTASYQVVTENPYKNKPAFKMASISIYDADGSFVAVATWYSMGKKTIEERIENKLINLNLI